MFLAVAATEIEMRPLQRLLQEDNIPCLTLVTGVGPIETAVRLTGFLADNPTAIEAVVNLGVAGAYISVAGTERADLLDLYLAETEVFGDLGICFPDRIEPLPEDLAGKTTFLMDRNILAKAVRICVERGLKCQNRKLCYSGGGLGYPSTRGNAQKPVQGPLRKYGRGRSCSGLRGIFPAGTRDPLYLQSGRRSGSWALVLAGGL